MHTRVQWIAAAGGPGLTTLHVLLNSIGAEGAAALAKGNWPALTNLDVGENSIGDEGVAALAKGSWPRAAGWVPCETGADSSWCSEELGAVPLG